MLGRPFGLTGEILRYRGLMGSFYLFVLFCSPIRFFDYSTKKCNSITLDSINLVHLELTQYTSVMRMDGCHREGYCVVTGRVCQTAARFARLDKSKDMLATSFQDKTLLSFKVTNTGSSWHLPQAAWVQ